MESEEPRAKEEEEKVDGEAESMPPKTNDEVSSKKREDGPEASSAKGQQSETVKETESQNSKVAAEVTGGHSEVREEGAGGDEKETGGEEGKLLPPVAVKADVDSEGKSDVPGTQKVEEVEKPQTIVEDETAPKVKHNRVESIEAPGRRPNAAPSLDEHRSNLGLTPSSPSSSNQEGAAGAPEPRRSPANPALQADMTQNRHESARDHARIYQPPAPRSYLQLRAMVLQLPNPNSASVNNPPTLILEGRTNLSIARRSYYPRITRTLPELQLWVLVLTLSFPASIFSPFQYPPACMTAGGSVQDGDPLVRAYLYQTTNQLARILLKPHVLQHPATAALVDSDFSYVPPFPNVAAEGRVRTKEILDRALALTRAGQDPLRPKKGAAALAASQSTFDVDGVAAALGLPAQYGSSSSNGSGNPYASTSSHSTTSSSSRNPLSIFVRGNNSSPQRIAQHQPVLLPPGEEDPDEEELAVARNEVTRLEVQFERAARAAQTMVESNAAMSAMVGQLARSLSDLGELDSVRAVAKRLREEEMLSHVAKGLDAWSSGEGGMTSNLSSTLIPTLSYQSQNARTAIDALLRRAAAATHRHGSLVNLVQKRREAERLKRNRGEIRQDEVDWILSELKEAQRNTSVLTHHLAGFTEHLREDLKAHSRHAHTDLQASLVAHARGSMRAHRFTLESLTRTRDGLVASREGKSIASWVAQQQREREELENAKMAVGGPDSASEGAGASVDGRKTEEAQQGADKPAESEDVRKQEEEIKLAEEEAVQRKEMLDEQHRRRLALLESKEQERETREEEQEVREATSSKKVVQEDTQSAQEKAGFGPGAEGKPPQLPEKDVAPSGPPLSTSDDEGNETDERLARRTAQSMFLPSTGSQKGQGQDRDVFESSPAPSSQSPQQQQQQQSPFSTSANGLNSSSGGMSQSAVFSPPRRAMAQYSNPFARLPDSSTPTVPPQFGPGGAGPNAQAQQPGAGPGGGSSSGGGGPWGAGRSRLSASDAARSLGGRF